MSRFGVRAVHELQKANGADVALLTPEELVARFPWLNVADIELGSLGLSGEGWFEAEARGFELDGGLVRRVVLSDQTKIECRHAVNAAGP